jgi:hypothetical protein
MAIRTAEKHYPICGKDVAEPDFKRFREWACSEAHAEEYLKDVRAQKFRIVAPEPCPLGMLFMMRAMQGHGRGDGHTISDRPSTTRETKKP